MHLHEGCNTRESLSVSHFSAEHVQSSVDRGVCVGGFTARDDCPLVHCLIMDGVVLSNRLKKNLKTAKMCHHIYFGGL